jgi:hypothetical protein
VQGRLAAGNANREVQLRRAIELNDHDYDAHSLGGVLKEKRYREAIDRIRTRPCSEGHPYRPERLEVAGRYGKLDLNEA